MCVRPKIYHITHFRNLPQIAAEDRLWSDANRIERKLPCELVGMPEIKKRRLRQPVTDCHPGTMVGQYVPFYFCPRSIMLYILHRGNHPDIQYHEGQGPIVHLQADLYNTVRFADEHGMRWAFTNTNAGARYASFFASLDQLNEVNWAAVEATDFRDPAIKEGKQAEFLFFDSFPWCLIEKIGVTDCGMSKKAQELLRHVAHQPPVSVEPAWYF